MIERPMSANELTRDAQIRTIARDVLGIELEERYRAKCLTERCVWDIQTALNAAFLAGMDFQRKQVQDAE